MVAKVSPMKSIRNDTKSAQSMRPIKDVNKLSPEKTVSQCAICLENITSDSRTLCCGHTFHGECVIDIRNSQWNKKCCKCPLCRAPMFPNDTISETSAEYRQKAIPKARKIVKEELKAKLPWFIPFFFTRAQEENLITACIFYQRHYSRIDISKPNDLEDLELSKSELCLLYKLSDSRLIDEFGIEKNELKTWIDSGMLVRRK